MSRHIDLSGKRFGRLVAVKRVEKPISTKDAYAYWLCKCDCGKTITLPSGNLKRGHTRSCGCLMKERIKKMTKHGMSKTRIYGRWNQMRERCNNPKDISFKNYGGRGISVCDEWMNDFETFYKWAVSQGYSENQELDRKNTNGDYTPENCRWIKKIKNARNKRNTTFITINNITKPITEWSEISGIGYKTIHARIKRGWPTERLLEEPV